jgi:hypothetical protein
MKSTPLKILPWLAHKAGIPEDRMEILWHHAQRHAAHVTGEFETPGYWQVAMDRLLELAVAESLREDAASYGWRRWTRMNKHFWQTPLSVLDAWSLNMARCWRKLEPLRIG